MELQTPRATAKGPASTFTGDVYVTPIYAGTGPSRMTVALVRFVPGARSNWHRHAVVQTLHVTDGVGLVGPATAPSSGCAPATPSSARPTRSTGTARPPTPS
jgi:hypothetical protein